MCTCYTCYNRKRCGAGSSAEASLDLPLSRAQGGIGPLRRSRRLGDGILLGDRRVRVGRGRSNGSRSRGAARRGVRVVHLVGAAEVVGRVPALRRVLAERARPEDEAALLGEVDDEHREGGGDDDGAEDDVPGVVAIEADQMSFQMYSSGVLTGNCGK